MRIILQSFFSKLEGAPVSVSRRQPRGYNYPEAKFLAPNYMPTFYQRVLYSDNFLLEYVRVLENNIVEIEALVKAMKEADVDISLLCWCDKSRQTGYDKLFCHTVLLGYFLEKKFGMLVIYKDGRDNPEWTREQFNIVHDRLTLLNL